MEKHDGGYFPPMLTGRELEDALRIMPEYDCDTRFMDAAERVVALENMYRVFVPSEMSKEIYGKLYLSMLHGLQKKATLLAVRQSYENSKRMQNMSYESILGGSDAWTIIGESGIGKSAAVTRCLNVLSDAPYFEYGEKRIIPYLVIQTPADASLKGLLYEILRRLDECLGTRYYVNSQRYRATTDILLGTVSQACLSHVCLVVLDEIQNVVNSKNGKTIVGILSQLINSAGISICMVGTPESSVFFRSSEMLARRSIGLEYHRLPYGDEFVRFCEVLYGYCYTKECDEPGEGLWNWLYTHSGGNVSILVSLLHDAQEIAILEGYDRLDVSALTTAYERRLSMLRDYIEVQKTKPIPRIAKKTFSTPPAICEDAPVTNVSRIIAASKEENGNPAEWLKNSGITVEEVPV